MNTRLDKKFIRERRIRFLGKTQ